MNNSAALLIDQATAAAFMGISITTFKRRRFSDKENFPKPVEGFSAKLYWKREDIRKYVDGLGYLTEAAGTQAAPEQKTA